MHGIHQSRGRIFFEVLCALAVSLSCVGTWFQTGATAILPAAAAALLYGLVRAFDMVRRRPTVPKPAKVDVAVGQPITVAQPVVDVPVPEVAELAEPAPPPARKARQPRASRKKAKVVEPVLEEEAAVVELELSEEPAAEEPMPIEEEHHASVTPLFEPVPFVRQQRTGFGRKAGLAFRR